MSPGTSRSVLGCIERDDSRHFLQELVSSGLRLPFLHVQGWVQVWSCLCSLPGLVSINVPSCTWPFLFPRFLSGKPCRGLGPSSPALFSVLKQVHRRQCTSCRPFHPVVLPAHPVQSQRVVCLSLVYWSPRGPVSREPPLTVAKQQDMGSLVLHPWGELNTPQSQWVTVLDRNGIWGNSAEYIIVRSVLVWS